jgi:hypothetical protein
MAATAWPLVGRREDLETVAAAIQRPGSCGAVLAGPAGVGKTRLLGECLVLAERAGYATLRTAGSQLLREVPLGALLPLLSPDIGTDPTTVLGSARQLLAGYANGRPALLAIDDAHLLDDASVWLIRQLTMARELSVVFSTRDGEPVPSELSRLWLDEIVTRIELAPLGPDQVDVLLHRVLGAPVDRPTLLRLIDLSDGNVLFLRELVTGAVEEGALEFCEGGWQAIRPFAATSRLQELVTARLAGLSDSDREILEVAEHAEHVTFEKTSRKTSNGYRQNIWGADPSMGRMTAQAME